MRQAAVARRGGPLSVVKGSGVRLVSRIVRLYAGLVSYGASAALMVRAELGIKAEAALRPLLDLGVDGMMTDHRDAA
jgi:hypothetical protein